MKTFDEAVSVVTEMSATNGRTPEDLYELQASFLEDADSNETLKALGMNIGAQMSIVFPHMNPQLAFFNGFMNGVRLGVSIGVEMERQEWEPPGRPATMEDFF